ncbi:MAG: NAD(P)-dependent alcohol dehydrogenase [Okeania sp. SIO3I5]|uniref:zinc-dependent alcohol dehydrogenase family protein n=1 Tax=Okeania sp. SIO3I5 TaxID=2607805 RepID=UPI0013B89D6A|nr:NAD(P)-dependent alcohol dehydrogenase [Okeania sp. SIO3I5]NEQ40886.1 NAD(P)-dependent alcohol dehydrogenase [Okeania sp. SIO3I5]
MKAFEIQEFGNLVCTEKPQPEPKFGEVLVKVKAVSLNYRDILMIKGLYNPRLRLPVIPCSDGVGEVVSVGEGVTRVKPGDRIAGIFMQKWLSGNFTKEAAKSTLGGDLNGMLAEYVVLSEDGVVLIPPHLSDTEAATLPCAAVTAWHALIEAGLKPGETVLVMGTGGVSLFALQFAVMAGARVIATSSSDQKLERVKELGASDVINYKSVPKWEKEVLALTEGVGVDYVVEVGGVNTLSQSVKAVRMGGKISLIGVLAGAQGEFNPLPAVMKGVRIQGIFVGSRQMFEAMNRAIDVNKLRPVCDRVFPFESAPEALNYMEIGSHFGKITIEF